MSFTDNPIVDNASKNSEESVLAVRNLFTQKNGFIRRKEDPDYGVDEDVELIINDLASSKKFAIQIKSKKKIIIKKSGNSRYISLQFKTSRLGYLLRRPPAYGIIIIYDDTTTKLYYEYVEKIYQYLNDQWGNDSWKQMDKPSICIPVENILNIDSVKNIHQKMVDRHKNNQFLLIAHGEEYGIPNHEDFITNNELDFNNPQKVAQFLKENGLLLLDYNVLNSLYSLISRLTISDISSSKELTLLASTVNCEIGNFIDADYFLKKCELFDGYTSDEQNIRLFTRYKTDFCLGNFDNKTYLNNLENQFSEVSSQYNLLIIKINTIYIKLLISIEEKRLNENIIDEIDQVFKIIYNSNLENGKKICLVNYQAFNLHIYAMNLLTDKLGKFKIKESLNISIPLDQRLVEVRQIINILELPIKYSLEALQYAEKNDDKYIKATSLYQLSHYFFMLQLNLFILEEIHPLTDELKLNYETNLKYALIAHYEFGNLAINKDAYNSLILALEISYLYKVNYHSELGIIEINELERNIKSICKAFGLKEYNSTVLNALFFKESSRENDFQKFITSNENELDLIAEKMTDGIGLPKERKTNILIDIENHRYFYKNRKSDSSVLLQDLSHTQSLETYYKEKPGCVIHCKKCGFETKLDYDIKKLMAIFEMHKCGK